MVLFMRRAGIIVKRKNPEAIKAVKELLQMLDGEKIRVFVEDHAASILKIKGYPREQIPSKADVIIVFGGDGTLLGVARLVGNRGIPILGVNLGTLGFITEIAKEDFHKGILDQIFSKNCLSEDRIMMYADIYRKGKRIVHNTALNDVVINKSALARMIELDMHVNKKYVTTFRADGLIVSTPTGSTAHSLSAGGPILYPTLESFVMTPICPHTLTNRPIVLPDNFKLEIILKSGRDAYITLDGQVGFPLKVGDKIKVRKAPFKTRFLLLHDRDYFKVLRTKLKWGE